MSPFSLFPPSIFPLRSPMLDTLGSRFGVRRSFPTSAVFFFFFRLPAHALPCELATETLTRDHTRPDNRISTFSPLISRKVPFRPLPLRTRGLGGEAGYFLRSRSYYRPFPLTPHKRVLLTETDTSRFRRVWRLHRL